jgi:STE24 endopeptidase
MYLTIILLILLSSYVLALVVEVLNIQAAGPNLPLEFKDCYDQDEYKKSQAYLKENTYFKIVSSTVITSLIIYLILSGGFNFIDRIAREFGFGPIITGLLFVGILFLGFQVFEIPFSVYRTFVIEEKYGFNLTKPKTFILDLVKGWFLNLLIGGIIFSAVIWFFIKAGNLAWLFCWLAITLFQLFLIFIAPITIMPLFNKFIPLEEGELKDKIQNYADSQKFKLKGIFKMDGSRRSAKSNAFFTGFGRLRRIVLFDTLIAKHTSDELVSVLAHEVGHCKKKHILKHIIFTTLSSGLMFFILSWFINNPGLFAAFKMQEISVYAGLLFFGFLYGPINMLTSILETFFSRKHEYEADSFAVDTYKNPQAFISALKKLSVNNLSNLTPHPLKVFLDYTHPPVLKRIEAVRLKLA